MTGKMNFDNDWRFYLGDLPPKTDADGWGGAKARTYGFGAAANSLDDSRWRKVDLPHDFVAEGDYTNKRGDSDMRQIPEMESIDSRHLAGGSLEGGVGWYRKRFDLPDTDDKRVYIRFDGVFRDSAVYVNEYYIGSHKTGYTGFYFDITDFVNFGGDNLIAVRVDSRGREGWWYEGGGIYRHVWLEVKENVRIAPLGVFVSAKPDLDTLTAAVDIKAEIENKRFEKADVTVKSVIFDAEGNEVSRSESKITAEAWDSVLCVQNVNLENVRLWSLESPYLYSLKTEIFVDGNPVDEEITSFGARDIEFKSGSGFYLNGRHVRVQGLCCHHDHAGVGIGIPDSVWEYRIERIKSIGANAYRSAHHQPSPVVLDICDRLGMLVFAETRRMSSAPEDIEALRTMVKTVRNHPSVFLLGIGNEEIFAQDKPETARATLTMKAEINKLDGTRPITSAVVCWNGEQRFDNARSYIPVTKNLDIMGFNYCRTAWDDYHERMPEQPIIITEATSNSGTRGCCETDEARGQYYVYDTENEHKVKSGIKAVKKDIGENDWKYFVERPYLAGIFLWTGLDYRGEPTPLAYPAVYSQFGILDYCGFEKDNFYYYKSWWTDEPVLHVFPHWNHAGKEGTPINVYCYSNLDEVEIFVNGRSYGKKTVEKNWYLGWENVIYEPGCLRAVGYKNGEAVMEDMVPTTLAPSKIVLTPYKNTVCTGETVIINVKITDRNGRTVPTADNEIRFKIKGGAFVGTGNGNPGSHESEKLPVRRAFNGLCQLLVKAETDDITVTAISDGIEPGSYSVTVK